MPANFATWLLKTREQNDLPAWKVAEVAGVSTQSIYNIESGQTQNPRDETIDRIEKAIDYLLSGGISEFGLWLKMQREANGISVSELSRRVGISSQSIYNLENGQTQNPNTATREKIESVLKTKTPSSAVKSSEEAQNIHGLGSLEAFDPHASDLFPDEPGVYVLYDISERPIYIGRSSNIKRRLRQHMGQFWYKKPIVASAAYIRIKNDQLRNQIEEIMIKFLKSNAVINQNFVDRDLEEK